MNDQAISLPRGKRPLRNLTPIQKLSAIARIRRGETKASVSRSIGVPESTLRGWCKNESKLRSMCQESEQKQMALDCNREDNGGRLIRGTPSSFSGSIGHRYVGVSGNIGSCFPSGNGYTSTTSSQWPAKRVRFDNEPPTVVSSGHVNSNNAMHGFGMMQKDLGNSIHYNMPTAMTIRKNSSVVRSMNQQELVPPFEHTQDQSALNYSKKVDKIPAGMHQLEQDYQRSLVRDKFFDFYPLNFQTQLPSPVPINNRQLGETLFAYWHNVLLSNLQLIGWASATAALVSPSEVARFLNSDDDSVAEESNNTECNNKR